MFSVFLDHKHNSAGGETSGLVERRRCACAAVLHRSGSVRTATYAATTSTTSRKSPGRCGLHHSVLPALSTEVAEAWERIIRDRKIKFCSNLEKTFADRVQDSRWGRPEWLAILLQRASGQAVWRDFYELATLACQARVQITEKEWLLQARGFGKLFTQTEHHQHRQLISSSNTVVAGQG